MGSNIPEEMYSTIFREILSVIPGAISKENPGGFPSGISGEIPRGIPSGNLGGISTRGLTHGENP